MREMREKIIELIGYQLTPFEKNAAGVVGQFKEQFTAQYGESREVIEAIKVLEGAFESQRSAIENKVIDIYVSYYDEDIVDALLDFYRSDAAKKMAEASSAIQEQVSVAVGKWIGDTMTDHVEEQWSRIFGAPAPVAPSATVPEGSSAA